MSIAQFLGPNAVAGTFGDNAYQRARAAGLSDSQINQQLAAAGLQRMSNAQIAQTPQYQQRQAAAPRPAAPPQGANATQFLGANAIPGTFGDNAYQRARAAGFDDAQINQMVAASGLRRLSNADIEKTPLYQERQRTQAAALQAAQSRLMQEYESRFESAIGEYKTALEDAESRYGQLENRFSSVQSELSAASAARDEAKSKAEELENQRKAEQEIQVSQQLNSLRSGSTVSGTPGAGLGNLAAGRSSYSVSTGARSGGVLDRAYKDIDPTDSVLNKDVAVASAAEARPNNTAQRATARQRALSAGGSASDYYAKRFG